MILEAIAEATGANEQSEEENLADFSKGDGYIRYFHHLDGRKFAAVASFPGDNEFGLIFEIKQLKNRAEQRILRRVARIEDGDLSDCTVSE